ncbi:MAG: Cache 3/Cache 2 fusion domain-containing protein [Deltaproteobacteria bacterium]|nr:Cache 3/Cache 2 fusion domain-containing protein [Deltaproteobacteria bacterium]
MDQFREARTSMIIPAFRDMRIRAKLVSVTLFLIVVSLLSVTYFSVHGFGKALRGAAEEDLEHLVRNVRAMCRLQEEMVENEAMRNLSVAANVIYRDGMNAFIDSSKEIRFEAVNRLSGEILPLKVPALMLGEVVLADNTQVVDRIQKLLGGICSVFQRVEGKGLLRITTTITGKDGKRATGILLPAQSPVTRAILAGKIYRGRAYESGGWYVVSCQPITDKEGGVVGALCVGVKEKGGSTLKHEIKSIKVAKTGYVYVMDSKGVLRIHPAKEGVNIINSKDSSGFEYIRALAEDAISHGEGYIGTIRYQWANPELGEKRPRSKLLKYTYFKPWDWIIAAGSYEEEIYSPFHRTERFIFIIALIALGLGVFLTLALSKALTRPIKELTEVTTKMLGGDLSQRVRVRGADEIGVLGTSFNRMVAQIEHYTKNLEKIVEARTSELKESREKYRDTSRFLNSILDSATEYGIIALDFYGNIIEFNKGAEKLFGWKKEELINRENIGITILPADREKGIQEQMSKRTRKEGVCEMEMNRIRKNGEIFPVLTTVTAIKDPSGKTVGFVEIIRDLTERKSLERELRETKDFLENIMESSVDGILTTDLKGKLTYTNRAMEDMLQYSRDEVLGTHISRFYVRGIQEAREIMALLRSVERAENYEMEVKRKDGTVLTILTSLFLLRNEQGEVIGTAGIFKDITEQKLLQEKLKAAQARMVEASKMRALGELVAGVAHELNNPLMASQILLHVILENLPKDFPERERLELIGKCNDRIEKIVEHLREFSRQTEPVFKLIDINLPVENALMITEQQLLNHGINVVRKLSKGLPPVEGDLNQLEQVFLNLISNARDALDDTEGAKQLTISSGLVEERGTQWVTVAVKDNGVGISPENLDRVFEPFFSTKPVGRGTGLGLSLCYGIIEAHKGRIEINSYQGQGTEVRILLPARDSGKG